MIKLKVFCFGFGQVAESFINKLINEKKDFDLSITSRQETHQIDFNNIKINSYQFSENKVDHSLVQKLEYADYILISIPPVDGKDIYKVQVKNLIIKDKKITGVKIKNHKGIGSCLISFKKNIDDCQNSLL